MSLTPVFEIIEHNVLLQTKRDPGNPDRKIHIHGDVARLGDGRLVGRAKSLDAAGNPQFAYGPWDSHARRAVLTPARDAVADVNKTFDAVNGKLGLHVLDHRAPLTPLERFCKEVGPDAVSIAQACGLALPVHPAPLFNPGRTVYQKQGIDNVRQYFTRHTTADYGNGAKWSSNVLTFEELWCIGMLPVARQNDHAIQTGRGMIRSVYGDVFATTVIGPNRRDTLIYSTRMMD
jgi:hypothetical protein